MVRLAAAASRRDFVFATSSLLFGLPCYSDPCFAAVPSVPAALAVSSFPAASASAAAAALLDAIPAMPYGAPATSATLPADIVRGIEERAVALEASGMRGNARSPALDGSWRLLYSNAREITNLASGLPLGFVLGPTYQPVDLASGTFENQGGVLHALGLAKAATTVVGDVRPAAGGTLNAAGTRDVAGNRVDVDFRRLTFSLDELLGVSLPRGALQKV